MRRVVANYARMGLTFIIGLLVTRLLVSSDIALFAVYSLVVIGLAFSVMLRELGRIALVPVVARVLEKSAPTSTKSNLTEAVAICVVLSFVSLLLTVFAGLFATGFSLSLTFADQFIPFLYLRVLGSLTTILVVPFLNVLAYRGEMVTYNVWLLGERVSDLVSVLAIVSAFNAGQLESCLIFGGAVYLGMNSLFFMVFMFYSFRAFNCVVETRLIFNSLSDLVKSLQILRGAFLLVFTMALYFRFSLLVVNAIFGETAGAIFAIASQLASYLRQLVSGLVLGVDSLFSKYSEPDHGSSQKSAGGGVGWRVSGVAAILFFVCSIMLAYMPYLLDFIVGAESALNTDVAVLVARLLVIGVLIRSVSEVWMQYLAGKGLVLTYARSIFVVACVSMVSLVVIGQNVSAQPLIWVGMSFVCCMSLSHAFLVPRAFGLAIGACGVFEVLIPVVRAAAFFSPL